MKIYKITLIFLISFFLAICLSWLPNSLPLAAQPLYPQVSRYSVTIPNHTDDSDAADIFYPVVSSASLDTYPIGLLLPGFNVDKYYYDLFARQVASYGFIVVVPNHLISQKGKTKLFAQVQQVTDVFAFMKDENLNPNSPILNRVDGEKLVLLGHSHGGFIGFDAIRNVCESPWCVGNYQRPKELLAGVFYGADFWEDGEFLAIDNSLNRAEIANRRDSVPLSPPNPPSEGGGQRSEFLVVRGVRDDRTLTRSIRENFTENQSPSYPGIPMALIAGDRDSLIKAENVKITYENIKQPPKAYIKISGANHYGITNIDNPPGSPREKNHPTLGQPESIETIARWSALFLRAYALNDPEALQYIQTHGASQSYVTVISQE